MTRLSRWIADRGLGDGTAGCRVENGSNFEAAVPVRLLADDWLVAAHHNNPLPAWPLQPEAVEADAMGAGAPVGW